MGRLLLVSNRLPVTVRLEDGDALLEPSSGGLASGLRPAHDAGDSVWIGWPGELPRLGKRQGPRIRTRLRERLAEQRLAPVELTREQVRAFYEDVANGVLWPTFHYLIERLPLDMQGWETYVAVNEAFAQAVIEHYQQGDSVWIHDYHLMLLPSLLRERLPDARIGFFLHIPFPSDEVFCILPWREELLRGLLGADLVGFHAASYVRHFAASLGRALGLHADIDRVRIGERIVRFGAFPLGVDHEAWAARAESPGVQAETARLRGDADGRRLLVGVDRLDYTKGVLRRLLAVERLLEKKPELRERVRLVQVTVPSRENVGAYAAYKRRVDEAVGRINGRFATPTGAPILRLHRALEGDELPALYGAADVLLATPLRDGMNLVAKEFVASRTDGDGVLVLSEFAGAADELQGALLVNPYDIERFGDAIATAIDMPESERRQRMQRLRAHVTAHDSARWASTFLDALASVPTSSRRTVDRMSPPLELAALVTRLQTAEDLTIITDYDGTLVPFAVQPDAAAPGAELIELLWRLAERPGTHAHLVSGRSRASLDRWFGALPIALHAEHGAWSRPGRGLPWRQIHVERSGWKARVRPLLEHFVAIAHGSFVEEKTDALVWHYRGVDSAEAPDFGDERARELYQLLGGLLTGEPLAVEMGTKVVEVRSANLRKSALLPSITAGSELRTTIIAIGDNEADEELFRMLPADAVAIRVGSGDSSAGYRLADYRAVRALLRALLEAAATPPRRAHTSTPVPPDSEPPRALLSGRASG